MLHLHGVDCGDCLVVSSAVEGGVRVDVLILIVINKLLEIAWNFAWNWEPNFCLFDDMKAEDPLVPLQEALSALLIHLPLLTDLPDLVKGVFVKAACLQDYTCL